MNRVLKLNLNQALTLASRPICSTPVAYLNQSWRKARGLPLNPNTCGVLTDGADYSFLDGKPTPYGTRQANRIIKQREMAEQIIKMSAEIDFAVDRFNKMRQDEEERRQKILGSKLKPKGTNLLKKP